MSKAPELYLTLEIGRTDGAAAAAALTAALTAAAPSSVLLRPKPGTPFDAGTVKTLVALTQKHGLAALIEGDANLARMIKADGVHLAWSKEPLKSYREARDILGDHAMIGGDAGRSRDDAMGLGEAGADYVAFGIPPHVEDRATAEARQCDLADWWSEIFEVPCVACDVATVEQARALANAGADFICVAISSEMSADDAARRVADFAAAITSIEATA
ncbi:MAG: thiamine phosphate synthase [Hyphomicrobium sp.]|nr:thiamine phosphate synthase [Hyphomicrobium sp.]